MYTVCNSKVVEAGGYNVAVVGDSINWDVASVTALPSCIPVRDYVTTVGMCFCSSVDPLLVRSFDASVVILEDKEECAVKGKEAS